MPALTQVEAQQRAETITVASYHVRLDLTDAGDTFSATTTARFTARPGAATFVDLKPHQLRRVTLNGEALTAECVDGRIELSGLAADNELVVEATMRYSNDGEGLHRHTDPADGQRYLYAMSFLDAAPRWFACFDQPDLKAVWTMEVVCPPEWTVAGNAPARRIAPGHWRMATEHPLSSYLVTLIAGPYRTATAVHDGIPLALHARASRAAELDAQAPALLALTGDCLDEFHRLFGIRYPWGEYHQAFVPDFNAGAMENAGCVTLDDALLFRSRVTDAELTRRASTIAHEMAHMWFGDLVTMRWWDDLWLNESFAEYLGNRVCDEVTDYPSWVDFGIDRKAWGYAADRRPSTHPVAGNGAADTARALTNFDGISYAKGASVLAQLAAHLGDATFLSGLRRHFAAHAYGNARFGDLIAAWTGVGAAGLPAWADGWLRSAGVDTLRVDTDGALVREPAPEPSAGAVRAHTVSVVGYAASGEPISRRRVTVGAPAASPAPSDGALPPPRDGSALRSDAASPAPPRAALVLADADDETWAKVALANAEWARMPE
ncbi:MAG: M1 family aminopeptidase, partial [Actinomycetia bacterium]|nr:M1 family aminopeptidase [Actinomycetes bacterium]